MAISPDEMKAKLREAGIEVETLVVAGVGTEQVMGEAEAAYDPAQIWFHIKNPRRLIRLQQMAEGGFRVEFALIDWDLMVGGRMSCQPSFFFRLGDLDAESQERYMGLYLGYLEHKKMERLAKSNIVIPEMQSPFGKVRPLK
jgi:hypothetical protein